MNAPRPAIPGVSPSGASVSIRIPPRTFLDDFFYDVITPHHVTAWLTLDAKRINISFSPPVLIDIRWPIENVELSEIYYDRVTKKVRVDAKTVGAWFQSSLEPLALYEIEVFFTKLLDKLGLAGNKSPTSFPGSDAESIDRLKRDLEQQLRRCCSLSLGEIDLLSVSVTVATTSDIRESASNYAIEIPKGAEITISVLPRGTAAQALEGRIALLEVGVRGNQIFIIHGKKRIIALRALSVIRGGKVLVRDFEAIGGAPQTLETADVLLKIFAVLAGGQRTHGNTQLAEFFVRRHVALGNLEPRLAHQLVNHQLDAALTAAVRKLYEDNAAAIHNKLPADLDLDGFFEG